MDNLVICDLGYVTGCYHYDDELPDPHAAPKTRKNIDRALAYTLKPAMDGYSSPVESFLNLDL